LRFILEGHEPVEEPDLVTWAMWMETADRCVKHTEQGDVRVSTVFLGLDHNFGDLFGLPILFETMAFVGHQSVARVDVTFVSGQAPVGDFEGPSEQLAADKVRFGTDRIRRWFDE